MSGSPNARRRRPFTSGGLARCREFIASLTNEPVRTAIAAGTALFGLWLIATTTLPAALAPLSPRLALALNPTDPDALTYTAEDALKELRTLEAVSQQSDEQGQSATSLHESRGTSPSANQAQAVNAIVGAGGTAEGDPEALQAREEALRDEIRNLARRLGAADPLNPASYNLLAAIAASDDDRRKLMLAAAKRSRHDREATIWLFRDALIHRRFDEALRQADILMRTQPNLLGSVAAALAPVAEDPDGRPALVAWLLEQPQWRPFVLGSLTRNMSRADTPFKLMQDLAQYGQPPSNSELSRYLSFLLSKRFPDYAYNVWVQLLSTQELAKLGFLNNPNFAEEPSGVPFDWTIARPQNATGEFVTLGDTASRAYHVTLGPGRVQFPVLSQVLVLPPGDYALQGTWRGNVIGSRGLVWRLQCLYKPAPPLGESAPLLGQARKWQRFSVDFNVPDATDCGAQTLRLIHDARSASEELVTGQAWLSGLQIERRDGRMN